MDEKINDNKNHQNENEIRTKLCKEYIKLSDEKLRDINNSLNQLKESKKTEVEYFKFIKEEGNIHSIVNKIDIEKVEIAKAESDLTVVETKFTAVNLELVRLNTLKNFECPKCGYSGVDVKADFLIANTEKKTVNEKLGKLKFKLEDHKGKKGEFEQKRDWLLKMQENIRTDVNPIKLEKDRSQVLYQIKVTLKELKRNKVTQNELNNKFSLLSNEREDLRLKKIKLDNQRNKIEALKMKIGIEEQARKEFQAIIKTNKEKIKNTEKENNKLGNKEKNIKTLLDYFNVIKELCKDENIKQYAISSIMPYLNQQTNLYLSEVGYGFYAVIDKWLKAQIKGPGVSNASYGSLSGGEGRGIDLAIQFALLDIARIQAGIWPDILIMDEILDSSVDSKGIAKLVEIIRAKQVQENNKIFVISHREEIGDEFEADFQYFIIKDRYSRIEIR